MFEELLEKELKEELKEELEEEILLLELLIDEDTADLELELETLLLALLIDKEVEETELLDVDNTEEEEGENEVVGTLEACDKDDALETDDVDDDTTATTDEDDELEGLDSTDDDTEVADDELTTEIAKLLVELNMLDADELVAGKKLESVPPAPPHAESKNVAVHIHTRLK